MKVKQTIQVERDVQYLKANLGVRYWEDATVNGKEEEGNNTPTIPCTEVIDNELRWVLLIDVESGIIQNWTQGVTASVHYKVCDDGMYALLTAEHEVISEVGKYVHDILAINDDGCGDYVIMNIDENGKIEDWQCSSDDLQALSTCDWED